MPRAAIGDRMTIVPRLRTPETRVSMRRALVDGHRLAFGTEATAERVAVALAMMCVEHGNGAALWNFDFGNIDALADWPGDVFALTAPEVLGGEHVSRTKMLRAYPSATDGAAGFWTFLASAPRFALALGAFTRGDPAGAAHGLKSGGWYTGSEADYARAMVAIYGEVYATVEEVGEAMGPEQVG